MGIGWPLAMINKAKNIFKSSSRSVVSVGNHGDGGNGGDGRGDHGGWVCGVGGGINRGGLVSQSNIFTPCPGIVGSGVCIGLNGPDIGRWSSSGLLPEWTNSGTWGVGVGGGISSSGNCSSKAAVIHGSVSSSDGSAWDSAQSDGHIRLSKGGGVTGRPCISCSCWLCASETRFSWDRCDDEGSFSEWIHTFSSLLFI